MLNVIFSKSYFIVMLNAFVKRFIFLFFIFYIYLYKIVPNFNIGHFSSIDHNMKITIDILLSARISIHVYGSSLLMNNQNIVWKCKQLCIINFATNNYRQCYYNKSVSGCNQPFTIINNTLKNAAGYEQNWLDGITVTVPIDTNQMREISQLSLWMIRLLIKKIICSSEIFL